MIFFSFILIFHIFLFLQIGLNGKGLESTVDALIGIDGFFRDTMQKTINYAADKVPRGNDIMQNMFPTLWDNIKMQQVFYI